MERIKNLLKTGYDTESYFEGGRVGWTAPRFGA